MRRLHVIEDFDRMGGEIYYRKDKYHHDPELMDAYECGRKDAYREIMEEQYGERHDWREMPPMYRGGNYRGGSRGGMNFREDEMDDDYSERRRRANGRYM